MERKNGKEEIIMAKDFDLDVQALTTQEGDGKSLALKVLYCVHRAVFRQQHSVQAVFLLVHKEK